MCKQPPSLWPADPRVVLSVSEVATATAAAGLVRDHTCAGWNSAGTQLPPSCGG